MAVTSEIEKHLSSMMCEDRDRKRVQWKDEIHSSSSGMELETLAIFLLCSELHIEDKDFFFRMFLSDVGINWRRLLAAESAIGALKPRLVSTLVVYVAVLVPLQGETTTAFLALERFHVVGADLARTYPCFPAGLRIELAVRSRLILADHVRSERRHHVEP